MGILSKRKSKKKKERSEISVGSFVVRPKEERREEKETEDILPSEPPTPPPEEDEEFEEAPPPQSEPPSELERDVEEVNESETDARVEPQEEEPEAEDQLEPEEVEPVEEIQEVPEEEPDRIEEAVGEKEDVGEAEEAKLSRKPTLVSKGETYNMCYICMGMIKHGLAMFVCDCRKVYHVSCGRRMGECPNCSTHLTDDMITGKEVKEEDVKVDYESFPVPKLRLTPDDKLQLLEERLILGEVGENVYMELKAKYAKELEGGAEAEALYRCPSCNAIVDKDTERCACGVVFSDKEGFSCPECKRVVPFDSAVCRYCGVRFSEGGELQCPSCGRSLGWGVKQCSCGTRFSDELVEGFQCPSCGKFLEVNATKCDFCGVIFSDNE